MRKYTFCLEHKASVCLPMSWDCEGFLGKMNLTHSNQMGPPTLLKWKSPNLRFAGWYFSFFIQNCSVNSEDTGQMPYFATSDLGLHYLPMSNNMPMSNKKNGRLIWVN